MKEFPRNVYKSADVLLSVNNEGEYAAAINDGWYGSVPEALARKHNPAQEDATAAKAKTKPIVPPDVTATLADLKTKANGGDTKALHAYADAAGIKVPAKADAAALYEVIEKALTTPA